MDQSATTKIITSAPVAVSVANGSDCERVNTVLDQFIEGQPITAEDENFLYDHATDCSPCFDDIKKQRFFVGFLNQRVARQPSPAHLHQTILAHVGARVA